MAKPKCPKCGSLVMYNVNSPFDHRNCCAVCGLSHEPGSMPMSLEKQIAGEGWQHPFGGYGNQHNIGGINGYNP
jgi:hypothetical protein